jgi:predicted MFS family arabinose efflux permease
MEVAMSRSLWLLAVGSFAIGTDAFVIAGVLPTVAGEFDVSVSQAGLLVTVFALVYAVSAPLLAVATSNRRQARVLSSALLVFTAANLLAALAPSYATLMVARAVAAAAAALYIPTASAVAAALVSEARRGRALAVVYGGTTLATALGVPIGTAIASPLGWRATFALVATLGLLATVGLYARLRDVPGSPVASLRARVAVARRGSVLISLALTVLVMGGAFSIYTYIGAVLHRSAHATGTKLSLLLLAWGVSSAIGNALGGRMADRFGSSAVIAFGLTGLGLDFALLAAGGLRGTALTVAWLAVWGVTGWSYVPAVQHRLVGTAPDAPTVALSLNASAIYVGVAVGGAVGGATLDAGGTHALGLLGALAAGCALLILAASTSSVIATLMNRPQPESQ